MSVERNVVEQRYEAVMAILRDGRQVSEVARVYGVTRQTMSAWVSKYEALGMAGLLDGSRRPRRSPLQTPPEVEAAICEMRRRRSTWWPRRISHELIAQGHAVSRASVYRVLVRQHLIEPGTQKRRASDFKRWERSRPMELWQMDVVAGVILESGTELKVFTCVDDHSRFCVAVGIVERARGERHRARAEIARGVGQPCVEVARHSGLVRVRAERELLDAVRAQDARDVAWFGRMLEHPRAALGEPAPNRRE